MLGMRAVVRARRCLRAGNTSVGLTAAALACELDLTCSDENTHRERRVDHHTTVSKGNTGSDAAVYLPL